MKKKAHEEEANKVATLEIQASKQILEKIIIESLKILTREEELRQTTISDQVPDEVVLEVVKVASEEEMQKEKFDARVQSTLETSAEIFFATSAEKDTELQPFIVQEEMAEEER